jgi:hypothetical protein
MVAPARSGYHAGHGADGAMVMTGREHDRSAFDQPRGFGVVLGPALVADRAQYGRSHRLAGAPPRERRPRVENGMVGQAQGLSGRAAIDEERGAADEAIEGLGVRAVDRFAVGLQTREQVGQAGVASGGGRPGDVNDRYAVPGEVGRKPLQPDVHHTDRT